MHKIIKFYFLTAKLILKGSLQTKQKKSKSEFDSLIFHKKRWPNYQFTCVFLKSNFYRTCGYKVLLLIATEFGTIRHFSNANFCPFQASLGAKYCCSVTFCLINSQIPGANEKLH